MKIGKVAVSRVIWQAGQLAIQLQAETTEDNWQEDLKALTGKIDEYVQENHPPITNRPTVADDDDDDDEDDDFDPNDIDEDELHL